MTPILGFAPDLPSTTPGVLTDCVNFIPYESGFESAPSGTPFPGLASVPLPFAGADNLVKLDGTQRVFTSTPTFIYELVSNAWTARNVTAFPTAIASEWSFAQIGDASLAANINAKIQASTTGNFTDIAQAPKARIVVVANYHVVAFNINDGTAKPAGWACSDRFDINTWTVTASNYADKGELLSTPGEIVTAGKIGDSVVAYKKTSIFLGSFVGSFTQTIDFREVPGDNAGCVGLNAWCDIDDIHFLVGVDAFWLFDGSRPYQVGSDVIRNWFYQNCNQEKLSMASCSYDKQKNRVLISYPSKESMVNDSVLVYHLSSKKWGRASFGHRKAFSFTSSNITIAGMSIYGATISALPNESFDGEFWPRVKTDVVYIDSNGVLNTLSKKNINSSFTTGDFGDDKNYTMLTEARLRFADKNYPTTASATGKFTRNSGGEYIDSAAVNMSPADKKFDMRQSGRFHRVKFNLSGMTRVEEMGVEVTRPTGKR